MKIIKMTSKLTIDEQEELIRVTSKMPVTSGLDKALSISIKSIDSIDSVDTIESVDNKDKYLNVEYPKDYHKWGNKIQENWKQAVRNEEKRNKNIFINNEIKYKKIGNKQ